LCVNSAANTGTADLIVRGTDNGIYHKAYASGTWSSSWDTPGGGTNDQPACVEYGGFLYVVVRGTDNGLYFNSYNQESSSWGSWVGLGGATNSPPTLVYDNCGWTGSACETYPRLDLFVRGTDNAIYHKAGTINGGGGVSWASSWDNLGGATPSAVSGAWAGTETVWVVVQGTDNNVYYNSLTLPSGGRGGTFSGWASAGGSTSMAMGMGYNRCYTYDALFLAGTDGALYGTTFDYFPYWSTGSPFTQIYSSARGTLTSPPAMTWISGYEGALVAGTGGVIYYNAFVYDVNPATANAWQGYVGLGGATPSTPAITNIATSC
jgi:hypothetical protein